jgi:hypothetical protein
MFTVVTEWGKKLRPYIPGGWWIARCGISSFALFFAPTILKMSLQALPVAPKVKSSPFADGIYFYGQSDQANIIGQKYFIFQVRGNQLKGALFMPRSEFYCATGMLSKQELTLQVNDPYGEDPPTPFVIALVPRSPIARGNQTLELTLRGYQAIATIGDNEQRLLAACL